MVVIEHRNVEFVYSFLCWMQSFPFELRPNLCNKWLIWKGDKIWAHFPQHHTSVPLCSATQALTVPPHHTTVPICSATQAFTVAPHHTTVPLCSATQALTVPPHHTTVPICSATQALTVAPHQTSVPLCSATQALTVAPHHTTVPLCSATQALTVAPYRYAQLPKPLQSLLIILPNHNTLPKTYLRHYCSSVWSCSVLEICWFEQLQVLVVTGHGRPDTDLPLCQRIKQHTPASRQQCGKVQNSYLHFSLPSYKYE